MLQKFRLRCILFNENSAAVDLCCKKDENDALKSPTVRNTVGLSSS